MTQPPLDGGSVLRARGVSVVYLEGTPFETWGLRDLDLDLDAGDLIGVAGSSGSGKSTMVQALCGLLDVSSGTVTYGPGIDPAAPAMSVGLVFQQPEDQIFERTVEDEVAFGPRQLGLPLGEVAARVRQALTAVGLDPGEHLGRSPFEMSGGEKRRVAIASLLAMEPRVLIFDEPTAGLDSAGRRQLLQHIHRLHTEQKRTVLVISHDMEMLAGLVRVLAILSGGRLVALETPAALYADPGRITAAGLHPPVWVELLESLRTRGLPVRTDRLTVADAAAEIRRALDARSGR